MNWQQMLDNLGRWSLAFIALGTLCYLSLTGKIDTSVIIAIVSVSTGYYFRTKNDK